MMPPADPSTSATATFAPDRRGPHRARRFVVDELGRRECGPEDVEAAQLVVSELVTRAIESGASECEVRLTVEADRLCGSVTGGIPLAAGHGPGPCLRVVDRLCSQVMHVATADAETVMFTIGDPALANAG